MRLLLDTHVLIWIFQDHQSLSVTAREQYADNQNELYFSVASYWEMCIKLSLGKLKLKENWTSTLEEEMAMNEIKWLPIRPRHINAIVKMPWIHRDPFDRLLVAQCQTEELAFMTADVKLSAYEIDVVW